YLINDRWDWERGIPYGERALAIGAELRDVPLQDTANMWLGQRYYLQGDYPRAIALVMKTVESLQGQRSQERFAMPQLPAILAMPQLPAIHARHILVRCLAELGQFREAIPWAERTMRLAEADNRAFGLTTAYQGLSYLHLC